MATTSKVLQEEKSVIGYAKRGQSNAQQLNAEWQLRDARLNSDQRAAVHHVLNSTDSVIAVRGGAGTGKTTLMQESIAAIEAGGKQVYTFAPSGDASRGVLRQEGFANATTIAELLVSKNTQQEVQDQVIWVDEAGLLSMPQMAKLFQIAGERNARVIPLSIR